jgi:MFS transporter, OFA family, oxalate/formate antiporter
VRLDPERPFAPARWPFFYGWTILVVSTIGVLASIPGQTMVMAVFADRFIAAAGISRTQLSDAYLLGTACSALLISVGGTLFDRLGARLFFVGATILFGLAVMAMSQIDRFATAVQDLFGGATAALVAAFALGFFLIRFLGQGMVTIGARSMLSKWFDRLRGVVISMSGLFVAAGFSVAPVVLNAQVELLGWRGAWVCNGLLLATVMPLMGWLFFRDNPEECRLRMDGGWERLFPRRRNADALIVRDYTRREALRTYSFWVFTLGMLLQALYATSYTFHVADIGRETGVGAERILSFFALALLFSVPTNIVCGLVVEFVRLRFILIVLGLGGSLMGWGILHLPETRGEWAVIAGMGISWGTYPVLTSVTFARYFGRTHLGSIAGMAMTLMVMGSALGPTLFARVKEASGSYDPAIHLMIGSYLALAVLAYFATNPQRRLARDGHGA